MLYLSAMGGENQEDDVAIATTRREPIKGVEEAIMGGQFEAVRDWVEVHYGANSGTGAIHSKGGVSYELDA